MEFEELIRNAFAEDFAHADVTSLSCIPKEMQAKAQIVLKQDACVAGLQFLPQIFQIFDGKISCECLVLDGANCKRGTLLAKIAGPARSLLGAERVAVNFLQHLCGVATLTACCVEKTTGTQCQILDTRKTILGLRTLQKYAVKMGGGTNHRMHLADRILIKNNHLALISLSECLKRTKGKNGIEIEIDRKELLEDVISAGVNAVLLDNMSPEQVRECVEIAKKRVYLEASGGITLENLAAYAKTGVDGISIGALTHSAPAVDISMRIT